MLRAAIRNAFSLVERNALIKSFDALNRNAIFAFDLAMRQKFPQ
jgi:hypothetical protein